MDWKLYKYSIEECVIDTGEDTIKLAPGFIQSFYIEKNYDDDYLPIVILTTLMGAWDYDRIVEARDKATFNLTIGMKLDLGDDIYENAGTYISDKFSILPTDDTPFVDKKMHDSMINCWTYGDYGDLSDMSNAYTFILAKRRDLDNTKQIINNIMTCNTILDAVVYSLKESGYDSNVLMSNPDNGTFYEELPLLPIPLINQLRYLSNYYGIYKEGLQLFFDIDRTYVIRKTAECTAYDDDEVLDVTIYSVDSAEGNNRTRGSYTDDINRQGHISSGMDQFELVNLNDTASQYNGNNSLIINNSGESQVTPIIETDDGATSFNIITTSSHNPFISEERHLRLKERNCLATICTTSCDLRLLAPNRCYHLISSDPKAAGQIEGNFRLSYVKTMFVKNGMYFTNTTEILLKKSEPS